MITNSVSSDIGCAHTEMECNSIIKLAVMGKIRRIRRRMNERERRCIKAGDFFVYSEEESKIRRWTDSRKWSPSRVQGSFMIYYEVREINPLVKKTYSVIFKGFKYHIVFYNLMSEERTRMCCKKYKNKKWAISQKEFNENLLKNNNLFEDKFESFKKLKLFDKSEDFFDKSDCLKECDLFKNNRDLLKESDSYQRFNLFKDTDDLFKEGQTMVQEFNLLKENQEPFKISRLMKGNTKKLNLKTDSQDSTQKLNLKTDGHDSNQKLKTEDNHDSSLLMPSKSCLTKNDHFYHEQIFRQIDEDDSFQKFSRDFY